MPNTFDPYKFNNNTQTWDNALRDSIKSVILRREVITSYDDDIEQDTTSSRSFTHQDPDNLRYWRHLFDSPGEFKDHHENGYITLRKTQVEAIHLPILLDDILRTATVYVNITPFRMLELIDKCWRLNGGPDLAINGNVQFDNSSLHAWIRENNMYWVINQPKLDVICHDLGLDRGINSATMSNLSKWKKY